MFVSDAAEIKPQYKESLKLQGIDFEENQHTVARILESDLVIKSPGIPPQVPVVQQLIAADIPVIDEIEFASRFTNAKIIAITGTNGKTTTTLLTYHLLKEAGLDVTVAGNIGNCLARQLISRDYEYIVLELSSFQLDGITSFHPHIAILLNITPDHMDRYEYNLKKYCDSKFSITKNLTSEDHFITFTDNQLIQSGIKHHRIDAVLHGISLSDEDASAFFKNGNMHFLNLTIHQDDTTLRGPHNAINTMSAISAAKIIGIDDDLIKENLKTFKNASHRLEYVATIDDVDFINDSKATNVDSVKYAMESFSSPLVWIAGGIDKGNNYDLIMETVNKKVKALVCLGKDNSQLREAFHNQIINLLETDDMKTAVRSAKEYAEAHDVVLLSPACASFDLFRNYEDRGDQFKNAVLDLKDEINKKPLDR